MDDRAGGRRFAYCLSVESRHTLLRFDSDCPGNGACAGCEPILLRVERVTIPGELDRLELVRRSSANRLQIAVFDRWAAPLEDMIRRIATADLTARLAPGAVAIIERAYRWRTSTSSIY